MSKITLYHNPRCSKSRAAKALLNESDADFDIVEYLKTPPDPAGLAKLSRQLGLPVREMMRTNEGIYRKLGLGDVDDEQRLLQAIAEHPILLQRPIAVSGDHAVIGRPPENVLGLS